MMKDNNNKLDKIEMRFCDLVEYLGDMGMICIEEFEVMRNNIKNWSVLEEIVKEEEEEGFSDRWEEVEFCEG